MQIDAIEVFHVAMPLISPWRTAYGEDAAIEAVLVRMQSGEHVGWGEAAPFAAPCYSPEFAAAAFLCVRDWLAPALLGQWVETGDDLQAKLATYKGNPFAKASLDTAWWTLNAKRRGQPLHRLLGATRDAVDVGADFSVMDSIGDLLKAIAGAVEAGFKRIKLKYRPGWDLQMLRAVRQEFPTQTIHIDCNSGYTMNDFDMFCRLDDFQLAMIEQPLAYDDLVDHARLQSAIRTPICLDESINSLSRAEQAIDLGSCRWVNIKPGRVGGVTTAVAIHNLCRDAGIPCWVGGMLESAVGGRICTALAMLDNFTYPADIFPSSRFYVRDLGAPAIELTPGPDGAPQVAASLEPGVGAEPDAELLKKLCLAHARIEPRS
jgi:O-succinylbenzoate synthase